MFFPKSIEYAFEMLITIKSMKNNWLISINAHNFYTEYFQVIDNCWKMRLQLIFVDTLDTKSSKLCNDPHPEYLFPVFLPFKTN